MPRTTRCPKCGFVQLAQASSKKIGAGKAGPTIPPPALRKMAPAPSPDPEVEDSPYRPPSTSSLPSRPASMESADEIFDRDRFLLRQRVFTIHEKYEVWDEEGQPILFVERPGHHLRNLAALLAAVGAVLFTIFLAFWMSERLQSGVPFAFLLLVAPVLFFVILGVLAKKRHIHFYRDDSKSELLLEVLQDQKLALLTHTYTVNEPDGRTLARLSKNLLTDLFRKQWNVWDAQGRRVWEAKEDSVLLALVRRFLTRLVPLCFIFRHPGGQVVGEFNRKFTILDRYVLDLSLDVDRTLDRRVAVAMGVMLDTGERR
jgi:uncharacterized protein YxjI